MKVKFSLPIFLVLFISTIIFSQPGWVSLNSGATVNLNSVYFVDENNGFVVGESGTVLKTTNGGMSWNSTTTSPAENLNAVHFFNVNEGVIAASGGVIFRTTNGGTTWNTVTTGVSDNLFSLSFSGATGLCGGSSQTILKSTNSGASWSIIQNGFFGGGFWGTHMINATTGFVAGENSIFQPMLGKTTNGGTTWDFFPFYLNSNEGKLYAVHFFDANNGITAAAVWEGSGAVSRTTDGGSNWSTSIFGQAFFGMHFPTSTVGYVVGMGGGIYKTTNSGLSWTSQNSGTSQTLNDVFFINDFTGFVTGENGVILKTTDGGVPVELTSFTANAQEGMVVLNWTTATETNNQGFEIERASSLTSPVQEWQKIGFVPGFGTTTEPKSYSYTDQSVTGGKYYYRLKQIDFDGSFTYSGVIEAEVLVPTEYLLKQNYPNPFNPATTIEFSLPVDAQVKIGVYNLVGEKVAEVIDKDFTAGNHRIDYNASQLTSGVYLYKLDAVDISGKNYTSVKKMTLLK
ncbi:MAG: T9SS type A sorting domain-containing protein [bacterium]|nr:T9SS type A sorting domain-containing protein [bacterium]